VGKRVETWSSLFPPLVHVYPGEKTQWGLQAVEQGLHSSFGAYSPVPWCGRSQTPGTAELPCWGRLAGAVVGQSGLLLDHLK